jgi:DNA-binding transcriptional regulator GbsR (MarR family)
MKNQELVSKLAESIGFFIEYWGFKSIHGRIWALIYLSERPISTPEIVKQLNVSKGLVSFAINDLLKFELIASAGKTTHGAVTYYSLEDVAGVVRKVLKEREMSHLYQAEANMKLLSTLNESELTELNISEKRLDELLNLTESSKDLLSKLVGKEINSVPEWTDFIKMGLRFLR